MSGLLDFSTLIFMVIAVVVFWRLRSVLGRRTGNEAPPTNPFPKKEAPVESRDNVITLPRGQKSDAPDPLDAIAAPGSALNGALKAIMSADRNFEATEFLSGARAAYEMIVTAFAEGDRETLEPLLAKDVYQGFEQAISERERRGEKVTTTFVGIDKAEIIEASLKSSMAQVTIRFVSQLISATHDNAGKLIDGDPAKVIEVTDMWTFERDTRSRDPNWKLVATEAEG